MRTIRIKTKEEKRKRRQARIRTKISGSAVCPRLAVFKSNKHMFVQLIDDVAGKTLVSASDQEIKTEKGKKVDFAKVETSKAIGRLIAEKALAQKIKEVKFDRGGNRFMGRIKAIADGAREGGLKF
ncbi:MAG TPA: 50S ribosomal protein L18 [Candidatus Paceibacterota bacterium]|jgi:large subunit ribosomal protein L18|nr:50S ribosomal protein L18 [Candidatus Paceibacterota bacterium]HOY11222.1 50S ribosomal protein L18 [Candidatus Paceibacterota bacterium]HPB60525.1 50S ribosomal protein L18 [Candidatus Paceibacterota bacterium]HPI24470.1 50S ribosomal protein L18 [Candidatus Paceibacterota bacterium]HPN89314.1 50S ribosomal protein L18 [Candidatus Paceibacterota bacterium]